MKIIGVVLEESSNILSKATGGGFMKYSPILLEMKLVAANNTLSGLIVLSKIIFCSWSHFYSHSPGSPSLSGVAHMYHLFHSLELCTKAPTRPVKAGIFSSSQIMSQACWVIQSGLGFAG